jgi:ribosomal protein S18 acetylase RimI-like enzyme
LVEFAESCARERGCIGAWVDTFSFQAPGFYERLGYRQFGELPFYPDDQRRIFFSKIL